MPWFVLAAVLLASGCGGSSGESVSAVDEAALPDRLRQQRPGTRSVTMEPAGTWYVDTPPKRLFAYQATEAEIALALGRGDDLVGMFHRSGLATLRDRYYRQLPGVDVSLREITNIPFSGRVNKELFYGMDPDVLMVDPRLPLRGWGWSVDDVREVADEIAPFFGNFIRYPRGDDWGPSYPQYSLDEYTRRYARLFDRQKRHRRLSRFRGALIRRLRGQLPPEDQRPRICVIGIGSEPDRGRFYLVDISQGGSRVQHYRDLGLRQAFDPDDYTMGRYGLVDYETLAAIDPAAIVVLWATDRFEGPSAFRAKFVQPMREHPVGRRLRAVKHDRVIPGGVGEQGPITHLFQLEMAAKQLFPETFGGWSWEEAPSRPLFNRGKLARIVKGDPR